MPTVKPAMLAGPVNSGVMTPPTDLRAVDMASVGYVEEEWFASGTATAYDQVGDLPSHGRWEITPASAARYNTRLVVRRPLDSTRWNGMVLIEWLNVSGGFESPAAWTYTGEALRDSGTIYVGLSAQALGVVGGAPLLREDDAEAAPARGIRDMNPERYGSLAHPGDQFSYDILSQVALALRSPEASAVFGGSPAEKILASGESQSASFLVTYINAVHPVAGAFDGYFIHSRGGGCARLSGSSDFDLVADGSVRIREDLDVPVLIFQTETDVGAPLGFVAARQPDTDLTRTWEVAGAAHADAFYVGGDFDLCTVPINNGPHHYVAKAAMAALLSWVRDGTPPPIGEPINTRGTGRHTVIVRDGRGIAVGGIRTPAVDVPVAALSGEAPAGGPIFCRLFGASMPFDDATLTALYKTSDNYRQAVQHSLEQTIAAGFIRPEDRGRYTAEAESIAILG